MTQDELLEQAKNYIEYNLQNDTILKLIVWAINNISNELYEEGYIKDSNQLTTCEMIIKEVLENGK